MSNYYEVVLFVGIRVLNEEFEQEMKLDKDAWDYVINDLKISASGYTPNAGKIKAIYTDDHMISIGKIICDEQSMGPVDIDKAFKENVVEVSEWLRKHNMSMGNIKPYLVIHCY